MNDASIIQESIDNAVNWTSRNCMKINPRKSKEMIITFTHDVNFKNSLPNIIIEGNPVETVSHAKLLGVTISDDLKWNIHIDNIVKKAAKRVYMLYQMKRSGISQSDLITVYISVVRPVLEYACPVWHINLPSYLSDNIEIIQKRVFKSIFPGKCYADILNDLDMCTLYERRNFLCTQYFNSLKNDAHKMHNLLPEQRRMPYELRPGHNTYALPLCRTSRFNNSLIPWGLYNWQ